MNFPDQKVHVIVAGCEKVITFALASEISSHYRFVTGIHLQVDACFYLAGQNNAAILSDLV